MPQLVRIAGIRGDGRHGARPGERDAPQPFVVDVEMEVEARGDDLASTADYRDVVEAVQAVIEDESYAIIETIAERVVERVSSFAGVGGVVATVHKPDAADRLGVDDVRAEARGGSLA